MTVEEIKAFLETRVPKDGVGCHLCRNILDDLEDGKLTGCTRDFMGTPTFPREGMLAHLRLEGLEFNDGDL